MGLDREELAWAAGFFDGEGHVRFTGKCLELVVVQSGVSGVPHPISRFASAVARLGSVYGPYLQPRARPRYYYTIRGAERTQAAIALLWNWLSEPKRRQAHSAMDESRDPLNPRRLQRRTQNCVSERERRKRPDVRLRNRESQRRWRARKREEARRQYVV